MLKLTLILSLVLASCAPKVVTIEVVPPETPLFSKDVIFYGVSNLSFANLLEAPDMASEARALVRKGEIAKVVERRAVSQALSAIAATGAAAGAGAAAAKEIWVYVSMTDDRPAVGTITGWLREAAVDRYENLPQAKSAARLMTR
jgi:hypothetical protein